MTQSEIAHVCPRCGASARSRSVFCSQCGTELSGLGQGPDVNVSLETEVHDLPEQHPIPLDEKLRHISHVVINQAAYDPSLRFVFVAAVLFVAFLVILILSKVIG